MCGFYRFLTEKLANLPFFRRKSLNLPPEICLSLRIPPPTSVACGIIEPSEKCGFPADGLRAGLQTVNTEAVTTSLAVLEGMWQVAGCEDGIE